MPRSARNAARSDCGTAAAPVPSGVADLVEDLFGRGKFPPFILRSQIYYILW